MTEILHIASIVMGLIGAAVIGWGVALSFFRLLRLEFRRFRQKTIFRERETIRYQLGSYLLLGLEFLIAADIIGTITHPTLKDMAVLASIVLIRTVISYFLEREVAAFSPPPTGRTREGEKGK